LDTSVHNNTASITMNSQNMMVFNVELGFTSLPHLPDHPARGTLQSPAHQEQTKTFRPALPFNLVCP
jgi:hypothetical protein